MPNKNIKQQGGVKRSRTLGNKGAVMGGNNAAESKLHRKLKKARTPRQ